MLKNKNLIKKVKVLSYNETNKKFDAKGVILSNIADAIEEYDCINFSCLKKYINNNIEYKISELIEEIKDIKKIIYNSYDNKTDIIIEKNDENILKKINKLINEFNIKNKDVLDKFLHYEKKNEYILLYLNELEDSLNQLEKNILEKKKYINDKESLKTIFLNIEKKFDEKINYLFSKYEEINKEYNNITLFFNNKTFYQQLQNLELIPANLNIINNNLNSLINFKDDNNIKIEKIFNSIKINNNTIENILEELKIYKNFIKELESKILLIDIDVIKNKKDIEFIKSNGSKKNTEISTNTDFNEILNNIEKKILILERIFNEEKKINTEEFIKNNEYKIKINNNIEILKKDYEEKFLNLENYKKKNENDIENLKKHNTEENNILKENLNNFIQKNLEDISILKNKLNKINDDTLIDNNFNDHKNIINELDTIKQECDFIKKKVTKNAEINKIDLNLLNSIIETIKEDIIKINKIILENNTKIEKVNKHLLSNVKEFTYNISIINTNNNFLVPEDLTSFISFYHKEHISKFINYNLLKFYTKVEFFNQHDSIIQFNKTYIKNNIEIKIHNKEKKENTNFIISNFEETSNYVNSEINISFPLNLSISPNNLKNCINFDYFIKRNNLQKIVINILGVYSTIFN